MKLKITTFFIVVFALTLGVFIFSPGRASAAAVDDPWYIPWWKNLEMRACDGTANEAAQTSWLSLQGNSLATSAEVPYGSTSVNLQMNYLVYICSRGLNSNGDVATGRIGTNFVNLSSNPNIPGLVTGTIIVPYGAYNSRWTMVSKPFTYDFGGPITSTRDIHIDTVDKKINQRRNGSYECVTNPGDVNFRTPGNYYDFDACRSTGGASLDMHITVSDKPPTIGIDANGSCNAITGWAWDEDSPGAPLRVDIWLDGPAGSGWGLASITANQPSPDVNAIYPVTGNTPHRFNFDITPYIDFATSGPRTFFVYFLNKDQAGNAVSWEIRNVTVDVPNCGTPFSLTPSGKTDFVPDTEDPTSVSFSNMGVGGSTPTVNGVTVSRKYVLKRTGQPDTDLGSPADAVYNVGAGGLTFPNESKTVSNLTAGDQVCYVVTLNPGTGRVNRNTGAVIAGSGGSVSRSYCDRVANKPYVSFYGNDVKAGGGFEGGSCNTAAGITTSASSKGSGSVQFAAYALGAISGFSSASLRSSAPTSPSGLTFTSFSTSGCTHDYFADGAATATPGPVTIGTTNVGAGSHVYRYVNGDVIITGNISMSSGPWANKASIPSFYLVAKGNIYIDKSVTRLDGVYVSQANATPGSGAIYTCTNGSAQIPVKDLYTECGRQLIVNGSFVSQKVALLRTYGSLRNALSDTPYGGPNSICATGTAGQPKSSVCAAEVFNFNPSLYIADSPPTSGGSVRADREYQYYTQLPPIL